MTLRVPWYVLGLVALGAAAVVLAILELGPPTSSARTARELVTAERGVVQSTVSGTGNVQAGTDAQANFQTSGTLQHVYVKTGEHVDKGQLLATLDPTAAQLTVDQAKQSLQSAEDNLTQAKNAQSNGSQASASDTSATVDLGASAEFVDARTTPAGSSTSTTTAPGTTTTAPRTTTTAPSTTPTRTPTTTTPATTPTTPTTTRSGQAPATATTETSTTPSSTGRTGGASSGGQTTSSGGQTTSTTSAQTLAANVASAEAAVDGAEATLRTARTSLRETKLYAPATGTVVSVQDVSSGDAISGASGSSASSSGSGASSSGSGSSSSSAAGGSSTTSSGSLGGSSTTSSSSSDSSSGFVEIVNTKSMTMTVSFDESDISKIKVGQPATVTMEALTGVKLGAHVTSVSTLGTTNSSVVSYDATLTLDQHDARVKPGMSASAAVITSQASGVTLPTSAVSGTSSVAHLEVMRDGKPTSTSVVVGVRGDSRVQIVSGLRAGQQVRVSESLPALGSGSSSSGSSSGSSAAGTLGGGLRGGALSGGAPGGAGFARRFGGG